MSDQKEKIKKLDNNRLIDVVKNYKQYGYNVELRDIALETLKERGVSEMELKLTGNYENQDYNKAERVYKSFEKSSKIAFILYGIVFILNLLEVFYYQLTFIPLLSWICLLLYFVFIIQSFIAQNSYYKLIGKVYGSGGLIMYLFLGMPFYFFMYFYFRKQMREELKQLS